MGRREVAPVVTGILWRTSMGLYDGEDYDTIHVKKDLKTLEEMEFHVRSSADRDGNPVNSYRP